MTTHSLPRLKLPVTDRDHVLGSPVALVTLVEYGDYECPHCASAYPIVEEICREAGDQLLFAFRNFPLTRTHEHAEMAAAAVEAAAAQQRSGRCNASCSPTRVNLPLLTSRSMPVGSEWIRNSSGTRSRRTPFEIACTTIS